MSIVYFASGVLICGRLDRFGLINDFVDDSIFDLGRLNYNRFVVPLVFIGHHKPVQSSIHASSLFNFLGTIKVVLLLRKSIVIYPWGIAFCLSHFLTSFSIHNPITLVLVDVYVLVGGALCIRIGQLLICAIVHYT